MTAALCPYQWGAINARSMVHRIISPTNEYPQFCHVNKLKTLKHDTFYFSLELKIIWTF